ncbi:MAG: cobalt transporter [Chloroflexi bacterium]|nr:MAG: cobalt transporter [Chloroflexota bacterium]
MLANRQCCEAVISIGAGVAARSVLLTAFGIDSVIELLSGIVVFRRLSLEAKGAATDEVEDIETTTTRISALLLVLLCACVLISSLVGLALRLTPEGSIAGIVISAVAVAAMPLLAHLKRRVNRVLGSPSLRADIAESVSCAYLAGVTLAGLLVSMLTGWWWVQYLAALGLLIWLVPEAREALAEGQIIGRLRGKGDKHE